MWVEEAQFWGGKRFEAASWRCKSIENIFVRQCEIAKHKEGPLLKEREEYLRYLAGREKTKNEGIHCNFEESQNGH